MITEDEQSIQNAKMAKDSLVQEYVLKMMGYVNELQILGHEMTMEAQMETIIQSLPTSF